MRTGTRRLTTVREVAGGLRAGARRSDVMVVAAALTCYAAFGLVPLIAVGTRIAAAVYGPARVVGTARDLARYLHGPLHLDADVVAFARVATTTSWWTVLLALIPASLYAEGMVRSLERFSRAPERRSRALRGRMLTPLLTAFSVVAVLLLVGPVRPLFTVLGTGTGARLLGILIAFNVLFFPVFAALLLVYRLFATTPVRRGPLLVAAFAAASWICGQLIGYTLALRLIRGFDNAFGHFAPAGEVAAITFLVYLEHLVFVLGYLLALVLHERGSARRDGVGAVRPGRGPRAAAGGPRRSSAAPTRPSR
jgi:membrane protein